MSDLSGGLFLEPIGPTAHAPDHHPQSKPTEYLCTCGRIREACVHDEIRAFWSAVTEPSGPESTESPRKP